MQYRKLTKNGDDISLLGYGCMRFQTNGNAVDKELAFSQMKLAFDNGVNYFDTAYIYHSGKSEVVLGEFIKKYDIRDKVYIADKLPTYITSKPEHIQKFFTTQLKRLNTHYIDYYLMHMLTSMSDWEKLKSFGIIDFINEKKASGEIRYIGFSFHGRQEEFIKIIEDFNWDFCQIQLNYLDENNQAGVKGMKRAYELGIGVIVMEPLRGGSLASKAPTKVIDIFNSYDKIKTPANWGFQFVMNYKEVATVLSGMNEMEHILENVRVACETLPNSMTNLELNVIERVKLKYEELMKVPCTGCNYCMPCPFNVDIPNTFASYNNVYFFGNSLSKRYQYIGRCVGMFGAVKSGGNSCVNCGKCKEHCPQCIDIPIKLKEAHKAMDNKLLRAGLSVAAKFLKR